MQFVEIGTAGFIGFFCRHAEAIPQFLVATLVRFAERTPFVLQTADAVGQCLRVDLGAHQGFHFLTEFFFFRRRYKALPVAQFIHPDGEFTQLFLVAAGGFHRQMLDQMAGIFQQALG